MPWIEPLDVSFLHELLQPISGQPLTMIRHAVGQVFEFGIQKPAIDRRGNANTEGDFFLKFIYADWRIVKRGRILLGSGDLYGETWFDNSDEPHLSSDQVEARKLAREFLNDVIGGRYVVESVHVGDLADLAIVLSDDLVIQSFGSSAEVHHDLWFFRNMRTDVHGLVNQFGFSFGRNGED